MLTPTHLTTLRTANAIPGDLWPDVLAEYVGSQEVADDSASLGRRWIPSCAGWSRYSPPHRIRLPLTHRLARAHVAHLMAAGLRCSTCQGDGYYKGPRLGDEPCPTCHGTGYLRPPRPAWHLLPPGESATPLPPELAAHAPALLACHVARVAAGGVGVQAVMQACSSRDCIDWRLISGRPCSSGPGIELHYGHRDMVRGAATNMLAAGFALVTADGIALPWPDAAEVDRG